MHKLCARCGGLVYKSTGPTSRAPEAPGANCPPRARPAPPLSVPPPRPPPSLSPPVVRIVPLVGTLFNMGGGNQGRGLSPSLVFSCTRGMSLEACDMCGRGAAAREARASHVEGTHDRGGRGSSCTCRARMRLGHGTCKNRPSCSPRRAFSCPPSRPVSGSGPGGRACFRRHHPRSALRHRLQFDEARRSRPG